ncbi:MAG: L,D-transpeptidase family protein [Firmicutes bacterium]|nr:L,D-transpeptidase family protein [Bacillota bacterium]
MLYASRYLRLMSPFMVGPDVRQLQERLQELGFYRGPLDGVFGPATETAVRAFQTEAGLTVDGIVGPTTWNALGIDRIPSARGNRRISIDTEKKNLTLREGNRLIRTYPVAVGRPETPTPLGNWVITEKQLNPGGPFGARWMRLSIPWGGYGIHGTNNPSSIGMAASHGCVRMFNEDVIELYDLVDIGTPVRIIGRVFTGRILRVGDRGSDVLEVQRRLQILGYYDGDLDGVYGPQTQQAVIDFQRDHNLEPDGIVGPRTYEELQKAFDVVLGNRQP